MRDGRVESFDGSRSPEVRAYPLPDDAGSGPQVPTLICSQHHVLAALAGRLLRIDPASGRYEPFAAVGDGNTVIRDVLEYGGSVYVLTHKDGLYECDRQGRVLQYFRLPHEYEKSAEAKVLYLDPEGIVWVATQSGLLLLDPETDRTRLLRADFRHPYSLPNNSVWSVYPDPDGGVWIGTYGGKLAYTTFTDSDVDYCFKAMPGGLGHPIVSCFEEDAQGDLWVGTEGGESPAGTAAKTASNTIPRSSVADWRRIWSRCCGTTAAAGCSSRRSTGACSVSTGRPGGSSICMPTIPSRGNR